MLQYVEEVGGSSFFYGACISMYSFSKICVMPLIGMWSDRDRMIRPLLFCLCFCILGNLMYASAQWLQSAWFILFGRCLIGIGSSSGVLSSAFITRVTTAETRTRVLTTINVLNMLALVLGPITNLVTTQVHFDTPIAGLSFNDLTNPGWLMAFLITILLVITLLTFEEPPRLPSEATGDRNRDRETDRETDRDTDTAGMNGANEMFLEKLWRMITMHGIWVFFIVSWNNNFTLSGLETALPAVTRRMFDFNAFDNSLTYCALGAIIAMAFIVLKTFGDAFSDRTLLFVGTSLFLIGSACASISSPMNSDPNTIIMAASMVPIIFAVPILAAPNIALYTKTLEKYGCGGQIGGFVGVLQTVSSISRMCSPLFTGFALSYRGVRLLFMLPLVFSAVTLLALTANWKRLNLGKPLKVTNATGTAEEPLLAGGVRQDEDV